jgi:hypothetical protein
MCLGAERGGDRLMKRWLIPWTLLFLVSTLATRVAAKDVELQGKTLISQQPPFTMSLPSEFRLVHSFTQDNPGASSQTRGYLLIRTKGKEAEEMFILQISDRTNPQAEPITAPPLKPYTGKRMYLHERSKKGGDFPLEIMVQLMAWNPDAPSLGPVVKKGIVIPPHWALQGQCLYLHPPDHAILIRYSRDVNSFGLKVSEKGDSWNRDTLAGNEKKAYEAFRKTFVEMIDSLSIKSR